MGRKQGMARLNEVCQLRTMYNMPCERCQYNQECSTYLKKEGAKNGKKKQRRKQGNKGI